MTLPTADAPTLTAFLLARIAEDEHDAECESDLIKSRPRGMEPAHKAFTPVRVLAECEAKRRLLNEHHPVECGNVRHPDGRHCAVCSYDDIPLEWAPCPTLRILAAVYADHPDYRDEWAL